MRKLRDAVKNQKKNKKSSMIQKYLKGFITAKVYEPVYVKMRMTDHFEFFDNKKDKMERDAATKIHRWWRVMRLKLKKKVKVKKEEVEKVEKVVTDKRIKSRIKPYIDGQNP